MRPNEVVVLNSLHHRAFDATLVTNDFVSVINSNTEKLRLYSVNVDIYLYEWHTLVNCTSFSNSNYVSPSHAELLIAIQEVIFTNASYHPELTQRRINLVSNYKQL